jgi:hypothetical protein
MRRPVFLIFVNAMILLVVFALLAQSLVTVQRLAVARKAQGLAEVQRGGRGDFRQLALRDFVKSGDAVRTGATGVAEFAWPDGTCWKLTPNSQVTLSRSTANALLKTEHSQLRLDQGQIFVRIPKRLASSSSFEVHTPCAVATARGTVFSVSHQGRQSRVCVLQGAVDVSRAGAKNEASFAPPARPQDKESVQVRAGELALVDRSVGKIGRGEEARRAMDSFRDHPSIAAPEAPSPISARPHPTPCPQAS